MATNTVRGILTLAEVNNVELFNVETQAQHLATNLFDDSFLSCMDKSYEEIDYDLKAYAIMTVTQGRIRLQPGVKLGIKSFVQWTRDRIRTDQDPMVIKVHAFNAALLIRHYKSHASFVKKLSPSGPDRYKSYLVSIGRRILSHVSRQAVGGSGLG